MRLTEDRLREYAKQIISMESKCIEWGATAERSVELCMEELRKLVAEERTGIAPKLCRFCGQPMKPKGVPKRPDEYDHAQGCPYSRKKKGTR